MVSDKTAVALVFLTCVIGTGVFYIKYMTVSLEDKIKCTKTAIKKYKRDYCILQAEWQALTNPERIQLLSDKYLGDKMEAAKTVNEPLDGCCSDYNGERMDKLINLISEYD